MLAQIVFCRVLSRPRYGRYDRQQMASARDKYERDHMAAGMELCRDKITWKLHWILLGMAVALAASTTAFALTGPTPDNPLWVTFLVGGMAALFSILWLMFAVMRTVVTTDEIHVQYGLWGPRVPIEAIESCEVTKYDWTEFGGWGIKYSTSSKTWAYSLWGHGNDVVRLVWTEKGKTKRAVFHARDPEAIVMAVQRARANAALSGRIEISDEQNAASEQLAAEQEARAEQEAAEAEAQERKKGALRMESSERPPTG
jgi:hypothetical protein